MSAGNVKHTPTPWSQAAFGEILGAKEGNGIPQDFVAKVQPLNGHGRFVDSDRAKANAEFIVRAVNCHEELVACLKMARTLIGETRGHNCDIRCDQINAAIAKAEGKAVKP